MNSSNGVLVWAEETASYTASSQDATETPIQNFDSNIQSQPSTGEEATYAYIIQLPEHTSVKPYEDYRAITDSFSTQYELLSRAYHADNGLLYIDGYLAVALGSKFGEVGTKYYFTMDSGEEIPVIKADAKQDIHTLNGEGWVGTNGHLMEMIVDTDLLDSDAMWMGDCNNLVPGTVNAVTVFSP